MKKKVSMLLIAAMSLGLAACGGSSSGSAAASSASAASSAAASSAVETEAASSAASSAAEEASGSAAAPAGEMPKIAYVGKVTGQPWWDNVQKHVEDWAKANGATADYLAASDTDAANQVAIMTDVVNQGKYDVLLFSANDPDSCEAICKEAKDKGMIVIATESSGMTNIDYDVEAFNEAGMGSFMMDELAKQMGEEGQYVTMVGELTNTSQNNWADAAIERQKEAYPNMEYLDERIEDHSDADQAYNKTLEALQKYPELKGILGTGSFDAPGAARAIKEKGLTGQVFAISVAMPSEVGDFIKEGVLQSVGLWDAGITAEAMLNLAVKMYNGEEVGTENIDLGADGYTACEIDPSNDKLIIGDGAIAVNADNVDDWIATGI